MDGSLDGGPFATCAETSALGESFPGQREVGVHDAFSTSNRYFDLEHDRFIDDAAKLVHAWCEAGYWCEGRRKSAVVGDACYCRGAPNFSEAPPAFEELYSHAKTGFRRGCVVLS